MLTKDACSHAIRSLVLSRLDYSNSLLINVSKMDIERLQRIQNRAARIVLRARKHRQGNSFTQGVTLVAGREKNFL